MTKVTRLGRTNDPSKEEVIAMLHEVISNIESGRISPAKAVVLALNEADGDYDISWFNAGMKMSECIALCDIAQSRFRDEMNY